MIDCKHILAALALFLPGMMAAVPADPRPRVLTNPDGSQVTVRVHGDESFHFMTDADCSRILERDARGFVTEMMIDGLPLAFNEANVRMLAEEAMADIPIESRSSGIPMQRMATLDAGGRTNYPTIGKGNRSLVVLVEFQDVEFTVPNPKDYFSRQLNEPGFSDYGGSGSALDYYIAASNGLYQPQFDVYGPVKVSNNASYFEGMTPTVMSTLIREALTELHDKGEIDFTNYDYDNDGVVDTVFFYYAGYGAADSETKTIWPHQSTYYNPFGGALRFDDKKIGPYACANELKGWNPITRKEPWKDGSEPWVDGIGTFVHEYGHVLGLPDLYDVEYKEGVTVETPGDWSVMASGCYNLNSCVPPLYSAYEQWVCRWLEFTEARDATSYVVPALGKENSMAVRIGIPKTADGSDLENEYFVIEARDKSGWDRSFPESGLLIWRINYSKNNWLNNTVNSEKGSNVVIHYANGENHPAFTKGNIYPGAPSELIPSKAYENWKSPIITGISYDAGAKSGMFDYNIMSDIPTGATLLHDNPFADEGSSRNFTLQWDPMDGADSYQLTIKRVSNGKALGIYDEFNVGNVTQHKVISVPIGYWTNEIEAYVRAVVSGIPCSDISNIVRFTPKDLPKGGNNAVNGIESEDAIVTGGVGCVIAPVGAQVMDMAGKLLTKDGLSPGVYIVLYAGRSHKVLVR